MFFLTSYVHIALAAARSTEEDAPVRLSDRKAELEKKRDMLVELRKAREVTKKQLPIKEVKCLQTKNGK